jgi:hypothetical protein
MAIGFWLANTVNRVRSAERGGQRHSCNGLLANQQIRAYIAETFAQHLVNPGLIARSPRNFFAAGMPAQNRADARYRGNFNRRSA